MHPIYPLDEQGNIRIKPIGAVHSPVGQQQTGGFCDIESEIVLRPELEPLLHGIDEFSHILVLYWLSEIRECSVQRRPQGLEQVPVLGMLATR